MKGSSKNKNAKTEIPRQFICPITHELMKDPVFTCDGITYERNAVEKWLKNHNTSPLTGMYACAKVV